MHTACVTCVPHTLCHSHARHPRVVTAMFTNVTWPPCTRSNIACRLALTRALHTSRTCQVWHAGHLRTHRARATTEAGQAHSRVPSMVTCPPPCTSTTCASISKHTGHKGQQSSLRHPLPPSLSLPRSPSLSVPPPHAAASLPPPPRGTPPPPGCVCAAVPTWGVGRATWGPGSAQSRISHPLRWRRSGPLRHLLCGQHPDLQPPTPGTRPSMGSCV